MLTAIAPVCDTSKMIRSAENCFILRQVETLDYFDTRAIALPIPLTALDAWNTIMDRPQPVLRAAFWLRDAISARFGVKRIGGFSGTRRTSVQVGEYLDFFLVEHAASDVLVLTERDRHLDVMTCISTTDQKLTITSSVVTHNRFGRLYMLPVGPAHKLIVTAMLRKVKRRLLAAS